MIATKNPVDFKALKKVEPAWTPSRFADGRTGVKHSVLLAEVRRQVEAKGFTLSTRTIDLARGGSDLAAGMSFQAAGMEPAIGVLASNDGRHTLRWFAGARDRKTGEGVVVLAFHTGRRYTAGFDLAAEVGEAVDWWRAVAKQVPKLDQWLRGTAVKAADAQRVMGRVVGGKIVQARHAIEMSARLVADTTAFDLCVTVSEAIGRGPAGQQLQRRLAFWQMLPEFAHAKPPKIGTGPTEAAT